MTEEQYKNLESEYVLGFKTEQEFGNFVINELNKISNGEKYNKEIFYTPLVYGYTCERESFSVNIIDGLIEVSIDGKPFIAKNIKECIPNKRAYASETDYYFVLLCRQMGYDINLIK